MCKETTRHRFITQMAAVGTAFLLSLMTVACGSSGSGGEGEQSSALPECPVHALDGVDQPIEVTVWHFLSAKTGETLEKLASDYNASQSRVHVTVNVQGTSNEELFAKYRAGIPTNDLPAIAITDDTVTRQMIDSGTVLPAQSCIDADNQDMSDFLKPAMSYYTVEDVLYPASVNLSSALLYFNLNHFRRAGIDPASPPKTLEELKTYAQKIKDAGIVDRPLVLKVNPALIETWLTGAGQPIVDNNNGRGQDDTSAATFDTETTVKLFTWIKQMADDGLLQIVPDTPDQFNHYLAMGTQNASMTIETSTAATSVEAFLAGDLSAESVTGSTIEADLTTLSIDVAPIPGITAPGRQQMGGGAWYITNTTPPEVQAGAWDFIKFINSLDAQVTWNLEASYLPYRVSAVEDPRVVASRTNTLAGKWLDVAYNELMNGVDPNFPGPLIGPYDQFRTSIRSAIESMTFKQKPPVDAVRDAANETTAALTQYNNEDF